MEKKQTSIASFFGSSASKVPEKRSVEAVDNSAAKSETTPSKSGKKVKSATKESTKESKASSKQKE